MAFKRVFRGTAEELRVALIGELERRIEHAKKRERDILESFRVFLSELVVDDEAR